MSVVFTKSPKDVFAPKDAQGNDRGADMGEAQTLMIEMAAAITSVVNRIAVRVATVGVSINISTDLVAGATLDGVTLATNDLVLVKDQTNKQNNGIYQVGTAPTRPTQYNSIAALTGILAYVTAGTINANRFWLCAVNDKAVLGSDPIIFVEQTISASPVAELAQTAAEAAQTAAEAARDDAIAAADSAGLVAIYATKAAASAALGGLSNGDWIEVEVDESQSSARTRYQVVSSALVLKLTLDSLEVGASEVTASGATQARTLADLAADRLLNPKNFAGAGNGSTNDTDPINDTIDAAAATKDTDLRLYKGNIDLGGRNFLANGAIDFSGGFKGAFGVSLKNGNLISGNADGLALDMTGANAVRIENVQLRSASGVEPFAGAFFGRPTAGTGAASHIATKFHVEGTFTYAALLNYASECDHFAGCQFNNDKRDLAAYAAVFTGIRPIELDTDDFPGIATEEESNIMVVTDSAQVRRENSPGISIAAITKANPAVVTYTGPDLTNGDKIVLDKVGGMVEVNNKVFTVANINTTAKTFELSGTNSSAYTTYTSGGVVYYQTGPVMLIKSASAHQHRNFYGVTYGADAIVLEEDGLGGGGDDLRDIRIKGHFEGAGIQSLIKFKVGANSMRVNGLRLFEHNAHTPANVMTSDVSGSGKIDLLNTKIEIISFQDTPTAFFTSGLPYSFLGGDNKLLVANAAALGNNQVLQLRRPPERIIVNDATWPLRKYNFQQSPAHIQLLDGCAGLIKPLASTNALQYSHGGWLDRVGDTAGPTITSLEGVSKSGIRIRASAGTDFSNYGARRQSARVFCPTNGDMRFDLFGDLGAQVTNMRVAIGFSVNGSSAVLADTDIPCTLNSSGVPTFTDDVINTDFAGIVYDSTLTTDNWWAVARNAAGTPASSDTDIAATANGLRYWSLRVDDSGNLRVFGSSDNITWTLLTTILSACTAASFYCAMIAVQLNAGTANRDFNLRGVDVRCLR